MKILIIKDENGIYQNQKGERYNLIACKWVKGERANEFKEFNSLKEAIEHYGLTEVDNNVLRTNI